MDYDVRVGHREGKVLLFVNRREVFIGHPQAARDIIRALTIKAKQAEEYLGASSGRLILDQAILQRAGAKLGLTSNPLILSEAGKEAAWNSELRRMMPGGIRSQEQFGKPSVIRHLPRRSDNGE